MINSALSLLTAAIINYRCAIQVFFYIFIFISISINICISISIDTAISININICADDLINRLGVWVYFLSPQVTGCFKILPRIQIWSGEPFIPGTVGDPHRERAFQCLRPWLPRQRWDVHRLPWLPLWRLLDSCHPQPSRCHPQYSRWWSIYHDFTLTFSLKVYSWIGTWID